MVVEFIQNPRALGKFFRAMVRFPLSKQGRILILPCVTEQ